MPKLTKKIVDASHPNGRDYFVWDGDLPGFGLRVFSSGKKSYLVQYRRHGRTRRCTIGLHGPFTPDKARDRAMTLLADIAVGGDPTAERQKLRNDMTVSQLCDLYVKQGCLTKKATTLATDKGRIERHIKPLLGTRTAASLTQLDIQKFHDDVASGKTAATIKTKKRGKARVRGGAGTAARTVGLLGGILTFAVRRRLIASSPAQGVTRAKDRKLSRFLSLEEMKKLGAALVAAKVEGTNLYGLAAIELLLLTGCRRGEILTLKWADVDLKSRCLILTDSKTGPKNVPIGKAAVSCLARIPRMDGNPYVLPAMRGEGHYDGIQKDWVAVKALAGISDVRLHDLRRTFASTAAMQGQSLLTIGKLLGHSDPKTTQIYAHLTEATVRTAANKASDRIGGVLYDNKGQ